MLSRTVLLAPGDSGRNSSIHGNQGLALGPAWQYLQAERPKLLAGVTWNLNDIWRIERREAQGRPLNTHGASDPKGASGEFGQHLWTLELDFFVGLLFDSDGRLACRSTFCM